MAQHRGTSRKSKGRRYGKAAGKTVASAMRRKKKGTLKSGRGGKGGRVKTPQTGNRNWAVGSPQKGCESSSQEGCLAKMFLT